MRKWLILLLIIVLLGSYGFFAVRWYMQPDEPEQTTTEPEVVEVVIPSIYTFPTEPGDTLPPALMPEDYTLTARHAFVYDCGTGQMLFTLGDQEEALRPASITKLLTAYAALQHMDPGLVVTAGEEVRWIDPESSLATVTKGDRLTVEHLIEGMMLQSGNDAAYVLAVGLGRYLLDDPQADGKAALAAAMEEINLQAKKLGMENTHFVTPDGDDEPGHETTAADMLTLGLACLQEPILLHYAGLCEDYVTFDSGKSLYWQNTNLLLRESSNYYCPEAIGLKTGYTSKAGACQLSIFRTGGRYLLIGVFGATNYEARAADSLYLYEQYR